MELQRPSSQIGEHGQEGPNFDRKLDTITAGAPPHLKQHLLTRISRENCQIICKYILIMQTEVAPTDSYRIGTIHTLKRFVEFHKPKSFFDIQRQDVIDFLDAFRKPESVDHMHKWVGTYEFCRIILMRFFKWLYAPDLPQRQRSKPAVMDNIPKLKRKEISISNLLIYGLKRTTLYFTNIVLLRGIGAGMPWPEIQDAGLMKCSDLR
jgi:hypothetical protein